jgi:hypothetical protein
MKVQIYGRHCTLSTSNWTLLLWPLVFHRYLQVIKSSSLLFLSATTIFSIIIKLVENKRKVILVSVHMSAAFDLLDKTILILKLRAHGFPEKIISIYQDFLSDRKAVIQVSDTYSETFNLEVGCVQGSPSGPLLFSLLVNNISDAIQQGQIVCYADNSYLIFDGGS